jgi:hypothetical protein
LGAVSCQEPDDAPRIRYVEERFLRQNLLGYTGESVSIDVPGIAAPVGGGLEILASDPDASHVFAFARLVAIAAPDDKASADQTIFGVEESFRVEQVERTVNVTCGRGGTHGSSRAEDSGCELVEVFAPAGREDRSLSLGARAGRGYVRANLTGRMGEIDLATSDGPIAAVIPSSPGAMIALVSEGAHDVVLHLPADFAADEILIEAAEIFNDFEDAKIGVGMGGRGARGAGAGRIRLATKGRAHLAR